MQSWKRGTRDAPTGLKSDTTRVRVARARLQGDAIHKIAGMGLQVRIVSAADMALQSGGAGDAGEQQALPHGAHSERRGRSLLCVPWHRRRAAVGYALQGTDRIIPRGLAARKALASSRLVDEPSGL